ncbi:gamma-secretase subunit APH-1A isoform X1 [Heliangelus exortis]|uniref:gamma-secretase subunit APH-1A isoform X1 n=1 Tax=Heliangelus exortis TaxID=472823 RepID=UPI003A951EDB
MGAAVFFGCAGIAFGPALALVLLTVAAEPLRVIVLVAGAFFWLVSLLLSSLLWFVAVQLSGPQDPRPQERLLLLGAALSVLLQESFRFAYFKLLKKADEGLAALSEDGRSPLSLRHMAYAAPSSPSPTSWLRPWGRAPSASTGTPPITSSLLTFLNPRYEATLGPIFILTLGTALWAFLTAGGSFRNLLKCLSCKQEEDSRVMMYSALRGPCED